MKENPRTGVIAAELPEELCRDGKHAAHHHRILVVVPSVLLIAGSQRQKLIEEVPIENSSGAMLDSRILIIGGADDVDVRTRASFVVFSYRLDQRRQPVHIRFGVAVHEDENVARRCSRSSQPSPHQPRSNGHHQDSDLPQIEVTSDIFLQRRIAVILVAMIVDQNDFFEQLRRRASENRMNRSRQCTQNFVVKWNHDADLKRSQTVNRKSYGIPRKLTLGSSAKYVRCRHSTGLGSGIDRSRAILSLTNPLCLFSSKILRLSSSSSFVTYTGWPCSPGPVLSDSLSIVS